MNKNENSIDLTDTQKKEIKKEAKEILKANEVNDKIFNKTLSKEAKIATFFDNIEFLSMDDEEKEEIALKIKQESS